MKASSFLHPLLYASLALPCTALAQPRFPERPVSLVVPFASGGTTDTEARMYTQKLHESTGQPWVFDFRPGAGSTLGTAFVVKARPDGYTLLLNNSGITVFPNFYPDLPFDVQRDLVPVTQLSDRVTTLVASVAALPETRSLGHLVTQARARPGQLNCSTAGSGGISHIVCAAIASAAGIDITPVHYKGAAQGAIDLIAGRAHVNAGAWFNALPNIKAGKLRVIAVLNPERVKVLPGMSTAREQGIDVVYPSWLGVFAPAGTSPALAGLLHAEFSRAVHAPDVLRQLEAQGSIPVANAPEAFRQRLAGELSRWKRIIAEKGIKAEGD